MSRPGGSDREATVRSFMRELCQRRAHINVVFAMAVIFLAIQLPYLLVVESGSTLYVVSMINAAGLVVFVIASGLVLLQCRRFGF